MGIHWLNIFIVLVFLAIFWKQILIAIAVFTVLFQEKDMDALKYKSVAVKLDIWQLLKKLGAEDFRSVGKVIEFLTMQECKKRNIE